MRCPKCGKDVELTNKQVGVDSNNEPIFNEYAICRDCKKQWNLDKQREKKSASLKESPTTTLEPATPVPAPAKPSATAVAVATLAAGSPEAQVKPKRPTDNTDAPAERRRKTVQKKRPASTSTGQKEEPRYANIPPENVRTKREKAVKQNYEEMLATSPEQKPVRRKKPVDPERSNAKKQNSGDSPERKRKSSSGHPSKKTSSSEKKPSSKKKVAAQKKANEPKPKFKVLRILFGVISIIAFGFFAYKGFIAGLENISSGKNAITGTVYIVLALCMLVSGLLLFIMRTRRTIFSFILPMIFYFGSSAFAFFKRGDDIWLLYGSIVGAVLGLIFLSLTLSARSVDTEDYDDAFDDDFE